MKKILIVDSSPMGESSASRKITRRIEERLHAQYPQAEIAHRDLAETHLPHLDRESILAFGSRGPARQAAAELSESLLQEFLGADLIVIGAPMWNFGVPSVLKAWLDHVVRAGKTFAYGENGPRGLLTGKRAVVVTSAGGVYSEGPMKSGDFVTPYLEFVLRFIGITDIQIVRIEGVSIPSLAREALPRAEKAVEQLAL
jgi:FMN-dependent NADH-azoreductase